MVVARGGEHGEEERLALPGNLVGLFGEVLQVRLIEDSPGAVEVISAL